MCDQTYNGYPTRETWAAALHQDNDEGFYNSVRTQARVALEENTECNDVGDIVSINRAEARYILAEQLKDTWEEMADPSEYDAKHWVDNIYPMLEEVGSLWRVDWDFIADNILAEH